MKNICTNPEHWPNPPVVAEALTSLAYLCFKLGKWCTGELYLKKTVRALNSLEHLCFRKESWKEEDPERALQEFGWEYEWQDEWEDDQEKATKRTLHQELKPKCIPLDPFVSLVFKL